MVIRQARHSDLSQVAGIFVHAFPDSFRHVLGEEKKPYKAAELIFSLLREAEPPALLVAADNGRVFGYIFAPADFRRIWYRALCPVFWWRGLSLLWQGEIPLKLGALRKLLVNKLCFLRSSQEQAPIKARVLSIAVDAGARGRGLGRRLLAAGLDYLARQQVDLVRLEVRPENKAARHLYTSMGFADAGCTADTKGEWVIMVKDLRLERSGRPE